MRKTLAIVLVVAFVLGLGSVVWADGNVYTHIVDGWGSFYSRGETDVTDITPVLYYASADELWVAVDVDTAVAVTGEVLVYNLDSETEGSETQNLSGSQEFETAADGYKLVIVELDVTGQEKLNVEHSIVVTLVDTTS